MLSDTIVHSHRGLLSRSPKQKLATKATLSLTSFSLLHPTYLAVFALLHVSYKCNFIYMGIKHSCSLLAAVPNTALLSYTNWFCLWFLFIVLLIWGQIRKPDCKFKKGGMTQAAPSGLAQVWETGAHVNNPKCIQIINVSGSYLWIYIRVQFSKKPLPLL